jgi:predicted permease
MLSDPLYRLRALFRPKAMDIELEEELRDHLERQAEKYRQSGLTPQESMRRARLDFGGPEQIRQQSRDGRGIYLLEDLKQDLSYGIRTLAKSPAFIFVAIFTLALGIGGSTAIFSLIDAVLLRSLPYGDSARLVYVYTPNPKYNLPAEIFSPSNADFFDLKKQSTSFSDITLFGQSTFSLATANTIGNTDTVIRVGAARVDADFFSTLQAAPELGRTISSTENQPGQDRVVIISHSLWQSVFNQRADILTQSLILDSRSYRVIGVMPPAFQYPHFSDLPYGNASIRDTQIWIPLALTPQQIADREGFNDSDGAVARLKSNVTIAQAQAEMSTIMTHLNLLHNPDNRGWKALTESFNDTALGPVRPLMRILLGAVLFVLLIACGNAANLLLARAASRTHELGVRTVLGAGRTRVIRQLLTESLLLGCAAGVAGIALSYVFLHWLLRLNPGDIPRLSESSLNPSVLLFSIAITLLTSLIFGALPAISLSRVDPFEFLKAAGNRTVLRARNRTRNALIIAQVALVFILLAGAGLLLRSYRNVALIPTGFSRSTIAMNIRLDGRYSSGPQRATFFHTLFDKLAATPGVTAVGAVSHLPLTNSESLSTFSVEGYPNEKNQLVETRNATPSYFSAMSIHLLEGRLFTESGSPTGFQRDPQTGTQNTPPTTPQQALINQAFARKYFPQSDPLGHHIYLNGPRNPPVTVVGILTDIRNMTLEEAPPPQVYSSFWQNDTRDANIVLRSALPPADAVASARATLKTIDPNLAIADIHTMGELVSQASARRRFQTTLLTVFAAGALFLAMVGLYGLMAYAVKQRTSEIGVRMALGASRTQVLTMVLGDGMKLVISGLIVGLVGALAITRILANFLYNVRPVDPLTFIAVPVLLLLVTTAACAIPGWRAAEVDPIQALRCD